MFIDADQLWHQFVAEVFPMSTWASFGTVYAQEAHPTATHNAETCIICLHRVSGQHVCTNRPDLCSKGSGRRNATGFIKKRANKIKMWLVVWTTAGMHMYPLSKGSISSTSGGSLCVLTSAQL